MEKQTELSKVEIRDSFLGTACYCGKPKKKYMSHCKDCYWKLPPEARRALYNKLGRGYEEAYRDSIRILRGGNA